MFPNNYFAGANFGFGNSNLDFGSYPFEMTNSEASTSAAQTRSDLDALDDFSTAEIENWWLAPKSNGDAGQYAGSTLLESSWNEFAGGCRSQPGPIPGTNGSGRGESHPTYRPPQTRGSTLITALDDDYGLWQQYVDVHEHARLSAAGPSTVSYPAQPAQLPSPPLATFSDPATTPSPVPTLSWGRKCPS